MYPNLDYLTAYGIITSENITNILKQFYPTQFFLCYHKNILITEWSKKLLENIKIRDKLLYERKGD